MIREPEDASNGNLGIYPPSLAERGGREWLPKGGFSFEPAVGALDKTYSQAIDA
jgi:hypothetical protein